MSYEPDFGGVRVSRIRKPFTQFLTKDASSSIYNRSSSTYKTLLGRGISSATIDGKTRYVMTVFNGTFYETQDLSNMVMTQTLFYSDNGKDWVACANNLLNYSANDVIWCDYLNKFFACGFGTEGVNEPRVIVVSSEDGITWSPAYTRVGVNSSGFVTIASSNDKIVIGNIWNGNNTTSKYSTDGITWNDTSITGSCSKVAWGNNLWTSVVDYKLYWSEDGITWSTEGQEFDILEINSLKYDGTIWAAMGLALGNAPSSVLVSNDGKTWNYQGDNPLLAVFGYNDDEWIAMGLTPNFTTFRFDISIQRSTDKGLTWTTIAVPIYLAGQIVFWDGEKWIITGGSSAYRASPLTIYQDPVSKLWKTRDLADQTKCDLFLQEKQVRAYENDGSFGTFN